MDQIPEQFIVFGPSANCTLELCPVEWSVYGYRPSIAANATFLALFATAMLVHIYLGIRWKTWWFMIFMILGCLLEIGGYVARIIMNDNPFIFIAFIIQIVCITCAPIFYTASIYVTLSNTIVALGREQSRIKPQLYYWIFIPADIVCLILQAAGGALSTISSGSSQIGVNIALAGLALQVAVLFFFCCFFADYLIRWFRSGSSHAVATRLRLFFGFLAFAIVLILGRCIYRAYELSQGYTDSELVRDEPLFIGLEGVLVIVAAFALCVGHPGFVFSPNSGLNLGRQSTDEESDTTQKPERIHETAL